MPPAHSNPVSISGFLNHKKKNSQGKNKEKRWKVQDYFSKIEQNNLANYCSFLLKFFYCLYKSVAKQIRLSRAIQWHLQIYEYIRRVFFIMSYSLFKIKCGGKTSIINQLLSIIFQGAINLPWIPNKNKFLKNYQIKLMTAIIFGYIFTNPGPTFEAANILRIDFVLHLNKVFFNGFINDLAMKEASLIKLSWKNRWEFCQ